MRFGWILLVLLVQTARGQDLQRFEFDAQKMGTTFRLVFYAPDQEAADQAADAAFARVDELNLIFSDYLEDSEISRLSQSAGTGTYVPVSREMWELLNLSVEIAEASEGAFDITAGPLTKRWRRAIRRQEFPDKETINDALNRVDYRLMAFNRKDRTVRLQKAGMRLDAGGIAKGYAVDEAYKVLQDLGIHAALVDGGGDIYAGDPPPDKSGWEVLINTSGQAKSLLIQNQAIASSGDTYKYLEYNGKRYSHIIDPRTGVGVENSEVVNLTAPTCTLADALASAISVLGVTAITDLLATYPEARLIRP